MRLKQSYYRATNKKLKMLVYSSAFISFVFLFIAWKYYAASPLEYSDTMMDASRKMNEALETVEEYASLHGYINNETDLNKTGLIGPEITEITTTLGSLESKRTTLNPNTAALIVHLFESANVNQGDAVAIGCSGSFPGLMIAVLSASEAMGVRALPIISIGASTFGATNPDFTLLDIYELLLAKEVFTTSPIAVSHGGENDIGKYLEEGVAEKIRNKISESEFLMIYEEDLVQNVKQRMELYFDSASEDIAAFVNVGGGYSNIGTSPLVLKVKPGLNRTIPLPSKDNQGVMQAMSESGIPVIHLLFLKGLAVKYGLTWDPVPLPRPGETALHKNSEERSPGAILLAAGFLLTMFVLVFNAHNNKKKL